LKSISPTWLLGGWFAAVAVIIAWPWTRGSRRAVLLFVIGVAPAVVMVLIGAGAAPSPTVAEILQSVHAKDGRS